MRQCKVTYLRGAKPVRQVLWLMLCIGVIMPQISGCGLAAARTEFLDATVEGKLKIGQSTQEVRKLVGQPDSTKMSMIDDRPLEVWIYRQTSVADRRRIVGATIASLGILGFLPVDASEKHFIVFVDGNLDLWRR